jgi:hypothetical protein
MGSEIIEMGQFQYRVVFESRDYGQGVLGKLSNDAHGSAGLFRGCTPQFADNVLLDICGGELENCAKLAYRLLRECSALAKDLRQRRVIRLEISGERA